MRDLHINIREIHQIGNDTPEKLTPVSAIASLRTRGIYFVGISDAGAGYEMSRPNPEMGHVIACFGGAGQVLVDGEWLTCTPGLAYLSPPRVATAFRTVGRTRWQFAWAYLLATPGQASPVEYEQCTLTDADPRQLVGAIEGLYRESTGESNADMIDTWAALVQHYVYRMTHPTGQADRLWRLWADVDANLAHDWTLEELADRAGLGAEALRRLSVKQFNRSPMRHVTHLRMRRAEAMLRSSPGKLYEIARAVGYTNTFAFSAAFSRWRGRPPKMCREP